MEHGKLNTYTKKRCRCDICKGAMREYQLQLKERKAKGDFIPMDQRAKTPTPRRVSTYSYMAFVEKAYGLSADDFNTMLTNQDNSCAICKTGLGLESTHLVRPTRVDHDHATGKVRGILCQGCNSGLGGFADDPARLEAAIVYLKASNV